MSRKRLTSDQSQILKKKFQDKPFMNVDERCELARSLNVSEKWISDWFNRMLRMRKQEAMLCLGT